MGSERRGTLKRRVADIYAGAKLISHAAVLVYFYFSFVSPAQINFSKTRARPNFILRALPYNGSFFYKIRNNVKLIHIVSKTRI